MMVLALAGAAGAAVLSGTGQVLQAVAARRLPAGAHLDLRLVGRLLRAPAYLVALLLTAGGFLLAVVALQRLPLFVVQSVRAANLVVAALLAIPVLGVRLRAPEWCGIGLVSTGLVLLATSVGAQPAAAAGSTVGLAAVGAAVALVAVGWFVSLVRPSRGAGLTLAALAGCGFALLAVGARLAGPVTGPAVLTYPLVWAAMAAGVCGLALQVLALGRAGVVAVTSVSVRRARRAAGRGPRPSRACAHGRCRVPARARRLDPGGTRARAGGRSLRRRAPPGPRSAVGRTS
jgi:drug/metabolite transporter (DMT)-like permease